VKVGSVILVSYKASMEIMGIFEGKRDELLSEHVKAISKRR